MRTLGLSKFRMYQRGDMCCNEQNTEYSIDESGKRFPLGKL